METKIQSRDNSNWFGKLIVKFEEQPLGAMALMLTAQSCWGSVAAMLASEIGNYVLLSICVAVTMSSNAAFIAQVPASWCLKIFFGSILINLLVLILCLLL